MCEKAGRTSPIRSKKQTAPKSKTHQSGSVTRQLHAAASDVEMDPPQSDDVSHKEPSARPNRIDQSDGEAAEQPPRPNPASRAKRYATQLHKFGRARPLIRWSVEQIKLKMLVTCGYPDFTPATKQPLRATAALPTYSTLLDEWVGDLWPKANRALWRNRTPQVLEDWFVQYILDKPTQLRNSIKQVPEKKITLTYKVRRGHTQTKAKVKDLLLGSKFLSPNLAKDESRFQNAIIGDTIQHMFFHGSRSLATPEAPIALVSAIVRHVLKSFKYMDGWFDALDAKEDSKVFRYYLNEMNRLARNNGNRLKNHWAGVIVVALRPLTHPTVLPIAEMEWGADEATDEDKIPEMNNLLGSDPEAGSNQEAESEQEAESDPASEED